MRSGSIVFSAPDLQLLCSLPSGSILGEEGTVRVQLAQQAQEILGKSDLVIITERVDDVALLIGQMELVASFMSRRSFSHGPR